MSATITPTDACLDWFNDDDPASHDWFSCEHCKDMPVKVPTADEWNEANRQGLAATRRVMARWARASYLITFAAGAKT